MIGSMTLALALLAGPRPDEGQALPFLHPLFTDHVVLQRDRPIPIWGWAEPGQRVKVALAGQSVETTAGDRRQVDGPPRALSRRGARTP